WKRLLVWPAIAVPSGAKLSVRCLGSPQGMPKVTGTRRSSRHSSLGRTLLRLDRLGFPGIVRILCAQLTVDRVERTPPSKKEEPDRKADPPKKCARSDRGRIARLNGLQANRLCRVDSCAVYSMPPPRCGRGRPGRSAHYGTRGPRGSG